MWIENDYPYYHDHLGYRWKAQLGRRGFYVSDAMSATDAGSSRPGTHPRWCRRWTCSKDLNLGHHAWSCENDVRGPFEIPRVLLSPSFSFGGPSSRPLPR